MAHRFSAALSDGRKLFYVGVHGGGGKLYCHPVYAIDAAKARSTVEGCLVDTSKVSFVIRVVRRKP